MLINIIVIFLILAIGWYFSSVERRKYFLSNDGRVNILVFSDRKIYIILISIILILQSGLRNVAVGADTYAYFLHFERVKLFSWTEIWQSFSNYYSLGIGKDPGYLIFQKLIQIIIGDYQLYLFVIASLFFSSLGYFLYKNTNRLSNLIFAYVLYAVLFYDFFSITCHRQTLATAATLYGFELIKRRKLIFFLILILLASTIHKSVVIFLPMYFLFSIKRANLFYVIVLVLFPVLFFYRIPISLYFQAMSGYDYGIFEGAGTVTFTSMILVISIVSLLRYKYVIKINPKYQIFYISLALALFFTPLTWVNPSAMRVVQYFSIFMLLLIPTVIHSFITESREWKQTIYSIAIIVLISLFLLKDTNLDYKFFWQEMELGTNYQF